MRRTLVFLVLGPILGVLGGMLDDGFAGRGFYREFGEGAVMAMVFGSIVAIVTGPIDGYFAHALPLPVRMPLTAAVGATMAVGLILALTGKMLPEDVLTRLAIIGAVGMGVCSLLSHDYRD